MKKQRNHYTPAVERVRVAWRPRLRFLRDRSRAHAARGWAAMVETSSPSPKMAAYSLNGEGRGRNSDFIVTQSLEWCFNRLTLAQSHYSGMNVSPRMAVPLGKLLQCQSRPDRFYNDLIEPGGLPKYAERHSAKDVRRYVSVIIQLPNYAIALTGCFLQTFSIGNLYRSTSVLDEACPLQHSGGQAYTRPSGS
jgi:hypothetical protein